MPSCFLPPFRSFLHKVYSYILSTSRPYFNPCVHPVFLYSLRAFIFRKRIASVFFFTTSIFLFRAFPSGGEHDISGTTPGGGKEYDDEAAAKVDDDGEAATGGGGVSKSKKKRKKKKTGAATGAGAARGADDKVLTRCGIDFRGHMRSALGN